MSLFRKPLYLAVTIGHFTIDIFNSAGPVLVTFLSVPMALSAAQIGFAVGAYQLFSALTQPFFGWLDDKIGSQWLGPGSVAWTISFMLLSLIVAHQTNSFALFVFFFVMAAFGSSAFHPMGTKHSAEASVGKAATSTAIFFLFGQTGLAAGPVLSGLILASIGLTGIYALGALAIPVIVFMAFAMRHTLPEPAASLRKVISSAKTGKPAVRWGAIGLLAVLIGLRSWAVIGTVSFLPKMFQNMGWSPAGYGLITGAYWMASAITGVIAGTLADRWGRRQVVFWTMLLGSISLYFLPLNAGWIAFPLAILTGGLLGASHSILVVISQSLLPGRRAFASGVTLGYLFGTGAVAALGIGALADIWGLNVVIQAGAAASLMAALLALVLPSTRETTQPQPEGVPA